MFKIEFETDNDAFHPSPRMEVMAILREIVVRLLDGADVLDRGQPGDRLGLDVDHDSAGDVVDDDRPVGGCRNGLEMGDDSAL